MSQSFRAPGRAPARSAIAPFLAVGIASNLEIARGIYAGIDVAAETYLLRIRRDADDSLQTKPDLGVRTSFAVGKRF